MRANDYRLTAGSLRELSTVGVVCGLSAGYAGIILTASDFLGRAGEQSDGGIGVLLDIVSSVFIMIALFVAALVISNGVDTVIAGRQRQLELLRLIGASAKQLRSSLTQGVAKVAALGALVGLVGGVAVADLARLVMVRRGLLPDIRYSYLPPTTLFAAGTVIGVAVVATVIGSRRTLAGTAVGRSTNGYRWLRNLVAVGLVGFGAVLLAGAVYLGEHGKTDGFFVAFFGTAITSVGLLLGAQTVVPALVAGLGRLLGSSPAAILARKNAVADKARTTRSTIGLFIGVTLIVTVIAGMTSLRESIERWDMTAEELDRNRETMTMMTWVLVGLIVISVIIAAVGFVSTMSLTVIGRTREIGMLRAMGFTAKQVRQTITLESIALSGTAMLAGLALGMVFGAVGSQSLIGALTPGFPIGLPLGALAAIVAGTVALVAVASLPPSRRAVSVAPVDALAVV
ncbi:ABC transporter permease [Gordonia hydrophobica]|uniref:FtsX-like permease family protein n=1 Tax=Gordonia hydrophobica TaxID=40516 RepID=A0ABZ2TY90_9ACTN|nr:FtsX-like permease family protein [Gordonia hydrophobica]MBM7366999.1 putative ABC transport system permease protein [Gordonia hydrophobica]